MKDKIFKYSLINAIEHEGRADIQAVLGKLIAEDSSAKEKVKEIILEIKKTVEEVNSFSVEEQKKKLDELGIAIEKKEVKETGLPELPNVIKGKVVMRLAPFPSGPLHIGNSRMIILNDEYVKRYGGKLLLVIDDTIGSEEKPILSEAYKMIVDGSKWLGAKYHKILYKSDRLNLFYIMAEKLIEKNFAYVCECSVKILRKNRAEGVACKHREQTIEENLKGWKKMLKGWYKEGQAVVRLKTDMEYPNPAFRDRVLLRIVDRKHPRVGKKYRVWPTLEFSWAIDDHVLGVTHIIRGKELMIEDMMEEFIWKSMGWKKSEIIHYGLLSLEGVKLSKTAARKAIEKREYLGWDDPRTWSLQSLDRRGIKPEAIRNFIIKMGLSLSDVTVPTEILYAENRKMIDSIANRFFAVFDPIKISVKNAPKTKYTQANLHPDFPKRGKRKIPVDVNRVYIERNDFEKYKNKEVGLMDLFTVKLSKNAEFVSKNVKYDVPKIHWVSKPNSKIKMIIPDGSIKKGVSEVNFKKLKVGQVIQMPRIGFARMEKIGREMVLYFAHK